MSPFSIDIGADTSPTSPTSSVFYIDACAKPGIACSSESRQSLTAKIQHWVHQRYIASSEFEAVVPVNRSLKPDFPLQDLVNFFQINTKDSTASTVDAKSSTFHVNVYELASDDSRETLSTLLGLEDGGPDEVHLPTIEVTLLPVAGLQDAWENLVFEPRLQDDVFNCLARLLSIKFAATKSGERLCNLTSLSIFLFWGPPGSGKTSLCKALAQKLAIRMQDQYPSTRLVELKPHTLYSKYFSESANMVGKVLDTIGLLLDKEPQTLVVVLVDEIESITGARDESDGEPKDAMRAVNALLTGIDRLRRYPNLLVFCTSNLIAAIDSAFLDRVDFKWHIPSPCARARYEILRQRFMELRNIQWIEDATVKSTTQTDPESDMQDFEDFFHADDHDPLPGYSTMLLRYSHLQDHPCKRLWDIAQQADSVSGRSLQRLPVLALALHSDRQPCPILHAIDALQKLVDDTMRT